MNFTFKRLLSISRPRFWIYVLGPYMLGVVASGDPILYDIQTVIVLLAFFIFFSFFANLLIYGVNDIYDYETDKHNPKKIQYEQLVLPKEQSKLWGIIGITTVPFLVLLLFVSTPSLIVFLIFLFTSIYYSANPIRAKARPPLDIIFSSIIYISPAVLGFFATGNTDISWLAVGGGLLWASAMQTYSAVPDIESDIKGGVSTLATFLGQKTSLYFCFAGYLLAGIIGYIHLGIVPAILALGYLTMVVYTLMYPERSFWVYQKFPLVNTLFGMILFFLLAFSFLV